VDNRAKTGLIGLLDDLTGTKPERAISIDTDSRRVRSFIEVQDGCSNYCTYCIVPFVRGPEKSLPPAQVIQTINERCRDGYREVVLTGTEIGRYHWNGVRLQELLNGILKDTPIQRLRLSSLQPSEITRDLIALWRDERLCPHFHLALQSGSNPVLKRMGRTYSRQDFAEAVERIRALVPEAAITTDIIVGFPGETPDEFEESRDFCRRMNFARLHVFAYSRRQGTCAASLPDQVKEPEKKHRSETMLAEAGRGQAAFFRLFTGQILEVLFEGNKRNCWSGYTGNYIRVYSESTDDMTNRSIRGKLTAPIHDGMKGELV